MNALTWKAIRAAVVGCLLISGVLYPCNTTAQPDINAWETSNGARVLFAHVPEPPMLDVRVVFAAGSARDHDAAGLAHLTNRLLDDGAGDLDANDIAERFAAVGAQFRLLADRDMAGAELRTLVDPPLARTAIDTFAVVLAAAHFPQVAFERERSRMQVEARMRQQSLRIIAAEAFWQAVYRKHPYAHPPDGTADSLAALQRQQVVAFYQHYYSARNAVVAMVGALSRDRAETVAETIVQRLPEGDVVPELPPVPPLAAARMVRKPLPASQTHILLGQPGMSRDDPLYFPLYVGNHVLGGSGLVSLLFKAIRAERGLSYNVYSRFQPLARQGPFIAGLQTRNVQAKEALQALRDTIQRFVAQGPTTADLALAKQNLIGSFPLQIDSNRKLVEAMAMMGFYDLPLDYLTRFPEHVQAVDVAAVQAAFQARLNLSHLATVVVGGASDTAE